MLALPDEGECEEQHYEPNRADRVLRCCQRCVLLCKVK